MVLLDVPDRSVCRINHIETMSPGELAFVQNGLRSGASLRVLCRHPRTEPILIECELDNRLLLSIPAPFSVRIHVDFCDLRSSL